MFLSLIDQNTQQIYYIGTCSSKLSTMAKKSMFKFRCVSNRWNNIIAKPYFLKSYSATTRKHLPRGERLLAFTQLTRSKNLESQLLLPSELGNFVNSSNWVLLPPPEITYRTHHGISTELVCEENRNELVPNYTVVRGGIATATWAAVSTLISTGNFSLHLEEPPLVWNGVLIMLPVDGTYYDSSLTRLERDNVLRFGIADAYIYQMMQFWMLPKNKDESYRRSTTIPVNEWVWMHTISSVSLQKESAIKLLENNNEILESNFIFSLEGLIPCNPNVVTKSIEPLLRSYDTKCGIPKWKHFIYLHMLFEQIHNRSKRSHIARKGKP
ncbi:hypothetical protein ACJIZ3_005303 [Penstemon smallii]|uniref:Uncharacterized protein n=1 Tax=Penstemon smallii TaxID=265156 RepID=A0ABD3S4I9_9LAMI